MPVQNVHFCIQKRIDWGFDRGYGQKMSGGVDVESSPDKVRLVVNENGQSSDA